MIPNFRATERSVNPECKAMSRRTGSAHVLLETMAICSHPDLQSSANGYQTECCHSHRFFPQRPMEMRPDVSDSNRYEESRFVVCQGTVGENSLPGYPIGLFIYTRI